MSKKLNLQEVAAAVGGTYVGAKVKPITFTDEWEERLNNYAFLVKKGVATFNFAFIPSSSMSPMQLKKINVTVRPHGKHATSSDEVQITVTLIKDDGSAIVISDGGANKRDFTNIVRRIETVHRELAKM